MFTLKGRSSGSNVLQRILNKTRRNPTIDVAVGFIGDKATQDHGGLTNVELAVLHEYGTSELPARPFLAKSLDEGKGEWKPVLQQQAQRLLSGQRVNTAAIGAVGKRVIREFLLAGKAQPALSPYTVEKKRLHGASSPSCPLVDTHQLVNSVDWKVLDKG